MKKLKFLLLIFIIIPCFLLSGCTFQPSKTVVDITQNKQEGTTTTYTITYSDGTTSSFYVTDGEDGADGENLTIESIKAYCIENNINYESFLKEYLSVNYNPVKAATNTAVNSAVAIFAISPCSDLSDALANAVTLSGGSGVIYKMDKSADGYSYIVTNQHVVGSSTTESGYANEIYILQYACQPMFNNLKYYRHTSLHTCYQNNYEFVETAIKVDYIGGTAAYDLAVLKVKTADLIKVNPNACAVETAESYHLGETAIAIGNPEGEGISVTQGIVSVLSEDIQYNDTRYNHRVLRIDTAVNGGNSGGGLFNINAELIGIVNAKKEDVAIDNMAYAIPVDIITKVANQIIDKHSTEPVKVTKLYLNIYSTIENSHAVYDAESDTLSIEDSLLIVSVTENKQERRRVPNQ